MSTEEDGFHVSRQALKREDQEFLDGLINRFIHAPMKHDDEGNPTAEIKICNLVSLTCEEIFRLCPLAVDSFKQQPALLRIQKTQLPLTICGDIHGQLRDVRLIVEHFGTMDKHNFLFMGDYGDRGVQGIETVCFLLSNKVRYPHKCFLLRGNHEDYNTSMIYGLMDECMHKFGSFTGQNIWLNIINVYNHMPFAATIADKIFALHGGLSPHLKRPSDVNRIPRPTLIPLYGLACDLVWSDPSSTLDGWAMSPRGISFTFDDQIAENFCRENGLELIVRGHQICNLMHQTGYKFSRSHRVLTLFTASDYLKSQNTGAVLTLDPNFTLFRPMSKKRYHRGHHRHKKSGASGKDHPLELTCSSVCAE